MYEEAKHAEMLASGDDVVGNDVVGHLMLIVMLIVPLTLTVMKDLQKVTVMKDLQKVDAFQQLRTLGSVESAMRKRDRHVPCS